MIRSLLIAILMASASSATAANLTIRVVNNEGYGYRAWTAGNLKTISFNSWIGSVSEGSKWTGEGQIWALMQHELNHALGRKSHNPNPKSVMSAGAPFSGLWLPDDLAWLHNKRGKPDSSKKPYTVNVKWGNLSGLPAKGGGTVPPAVVRAGCIKAMVTLTTLCNVRYVLPGQPDPPPKPPAPPKPVDRKEVEKRLKDIEKAIDRIRGEISIAP